YRYHDIRDLILLVGYKYLQIQNYFDHGERFDVSLQYVIDKPQRKGSANALLNAYDEGALTEDDTLIVYYGDIVSNINLKNMLKNHKESKALATVALATGFNVNVGTAEVKDNWIEGFIEKPRLNTPVSIGIIILEGEVLRYMQELYNDGQFESFDLMGDVIQYLVNKKEKVAAHLTDSFWYDVGSMEKYEKLSNERLSEELGFLL
ncbi:nucleotidyltransferase family protein, partial [Candidatus Bathyarchaeota archaeon]|nr:nucleotidyltransferase family protein [Candidatus Bathyarchaeota archaeon]